jgi:hypothetical protein
VLCAVHRDHVSSVLNQRAFLLASKKLIISIVRSSQWSPFKLHRIATTATHNRAYYIMPPYCDRRSYLHTLATPSHWSLGLLQWRDDPTRGNLRRRKRIDAISSGHRQGVRGEEPSQMGRGTQVRGVGPEATRSCLCRIEICGGGENTRKQAGCRCLWRDGVRLDG